MTSRWQKSGNSPLSWTQAIRRTGPLRESACMSFLPGVARGDGGQVRFGPPRALARDRVERHHARLQATLDDRVQLALEDAVHEEALAGVVVSVLDLLQRLGVLELVALDLGEGIAVRRQVEGGAGLPPRREPGR